MDLGIPGHTLSSFFMVSGNFAGWAVSMHMANVFLSYFLYFCRAAMPTAPCGSTIVSYFTYTQLIILIVSLSLIATENICFFISSKFGFLWTMPFLTIMTLKLLKYLTRLFGLPIFMAFEMQF